MARGLGQQVLTIQVAASLGSHADDFYVDAIVDEIVSEYGFVDIDEIPKDKYWDIVQDYDKTRSPGNR